LFLIISAASGGFGGFLITLSLVALATAIYAVVTRRPTWLNLPRSRPLGAAGIGAALVVLVLGSSLYGASHPTKLDGQPKSAFAQTSSSPSDLSDVLVSDVVGANALNAKSTLLNNGLHVTVKTADGSNLPSDLTGWTVDSQYPSAGSNVDPHGDVILTLARATPTPTPSATATSSSSPAPVTTTAPHLTAPVAPAPVAPAPAAPAPVAPAPAPAPVTVTVNPGGFCSPGDVGHSGVGPNGHIYVCGAKGADASGHYHWNS
jgi:hypothetical protein